MDSSEPALNYHGKKLTPWFPYLGPLNGRIGLIADSHGNLTAMQACIQLLQENRGVRDFIHLGDLFDSLQRSHIDEMIQALIRLNLSMVRGNNDFHIQNMLASGASMQLPDNDRPRILSFLESLPMKIVYPDICFTHSLPFDSIRSLYEPVDNGTTIRAKQIFQQTPYHLICCGHSHTPVLFRFRAGVVTRECINLKEAIFLDPGERYIIVVGASENGECGVLDCSQKTYERICLSPDKGLY
jgi:predicted phosphodiesterase